MMPQRIGDQTEDFGCDERHIRQMDQPALPVRRSANAGGNGIPETCTGDRRDRHLIRGANLLYPLVIRPSDDPHRQTGGQRLAQGMFKQRAPAARLIRKLSV
ncbi:hypothetical protein D3C79_470540 [compost metagenome]